MSETALESEEKQARQRSLHIGMGLVLGKLQHDPSALTTADAGALADMAEGSNAHTATVLAALTDLAMHNESMAAASRGDERACISHVGRMVENLHAAVKDSPGDVTTEILQTTESILDSELVLPWRSQLLTPVQ